MVGISGAILGSAAIGAGASLIGSSQQASAAESAAGLQAEATQLAVGEQRRQFDLTREDLAPYREIGTTALSELGALYGIGRGGLLPATEAEADALSAGAPAPAPAAAAPQAMSIPSLVQVSLGPTPGADRIFVNGQDTGLHTGDVAAQGGAAWVQGLGLGNREDDEGAIIQSDPSQSVFMPADSLPAALRQRFGGAANPLAAAAGPNPPAAGGTANPLAAAGMTPTSNSLEAARSRFVETPGYQFRFNEGLRALDRSAAARGRLHSGGYARELEQYGQGLAAAEFGNYANRLASLAGVGQTATTAGAGIGAATASNIGNLLTAGAANQGNALLNAATARASGYTGVANQVSGATNNFLFLEALRRSGGNQLPLG